jgi:hypothetical protein
MTTENNEPTIEESALDLSLDALLKAAGAEDTVDQLRKGGQVYSGFNDERGKQGGGGASSSDAGGLDNMMIGKLIAKGMPEVMARQVAGDMMGLLNESGMIGRKNGDDDEDEDEDEDEMTAYARGYMEASKKFGKSDDFEDYDDGDESFAKSFREDEDIEPAVDASPFMDQLVARTTGALDGLNKSMKAGRAQQGKVNVAMARAVAQQGLLLKSQNNVIDELAKRLGMVESQPATAPKGARSAPEAQALAKSMPGEHGTGNPPEALNKGQAAKVLSYMRFEKGMETIEGEATGQAACRAEAGGILSKSVDAYINKWLATHPNEREAALNYA